MGISVGILAFCVIAFVTEEHAPFWNMGMIAMIGAVLCVATGCISQKRVFGTMDWTTVVIMGSSFGIGRALEDSGAGALIAQTAVGLLGENVTPFLLCAALALVAMILSNFMSSTATATLLAPIAALVAAELGFNVKSVVMATVIAVNIGFATPISTPPVTMTLVGGYRFKDYVKVGGTLNLILYALIIVLFPIILNF
jgi:di/tricarboxylate transporter